MSANVWPPSPSMRESDFDRALRLQQEREAKRVSEEIDRAIEKERQELRKRRPRTRILILGQAESGKSTMLKNFQLHFAPATFHAHIEAWRAVIHLNLVRSVNALLDLLGDAQRRLRMRLSPLRQVEVVLGRYLAGDTYSLDSAPVRVTWMPEVAVRGGARWKTKVDPRDVDMLEDTRNILETCREYIVELWAAPELHNCLQEAEIVLEEQPGFFLDQADRIAAQGYVPTPDDILRARLKTVGVEEHHLIMETDVEHGKEWVFYDVGGCRSQRAAWMPFFEDVNAIIFLCPVSAFNQMLDEDPQVNRLLDSFALWKALCEAKLLVNVTFILLLNKKDVLDSKLKTGIQFSDYVSLYRGQPNDTENVTGYLKKKFVSLHRQASPRGRQLHIHVTCAIDTTLMGLVLIGIRDVILTNALKDTNLI